jgi:hypothetical protein
MLRRWDVRMICADMPPYRLNSGLGMNCRPQGGSGLETTRMEPYRLSRCRGLAVACVLAVAGVTQAAAQFPPPPGQGQAPAQDPAFPPPPGQQRQAPAQDSAFPPPPSPGQASLRGGISVAPGGGGSFSPAPSNGGFPSPSGGGFSPPAPAGPSEAQRVCLQFPTIR